MNIKKFILENLIFPEIISIKKPGVIITYVVRKYGKTSSKIRPTYIFEDVLVNLQLDTIKHIGRKKTDDLWYKIGKDIIISYFLVSEAKRPPKILFEDTLRYILTRISISGMSMGANIILNNKNFSLILKGQDNIICRKSSIGSVHAGLVSGIVSFLTGENIEAQMIKCCYYEEDYCKIICNKSISQRYKSNYTGIQSLIKNYILVLPNESESIFSKYNYLATFDRFMKFNKIKIDKNITYFYKVPIISGEINTTDHIIRNYINLNLLNLLKKSIIKSSEKIIKDILEKKELTQEEKLKFIQNMMSAFGWGIPLYEIKKDRIIFNFVFGAQAITNSFLFYALQLNGFLNHIFNKKIKLRKTDMILGKVPISKAIYKF